MPIAWCEIFRLRPANEVEEKLSVLLPTLKKHPYRWALIGGDVATLVCVFHPMTGAIPR